ncbi:MAG: hypothetical protein QM737_23375 [Ferruginibacter sp.]
MGLEKKYKKSIANELNRFAIWEPGENISLGDYGVVENGDFQKMGNIKDDFKTQFSIQRTPKSFWEYASVGTKHSDNSSTVGLDGKQIPVNGKACFQISFENAFSLFIRTNNSVNSNIANLNEVCKQLRTIKQWKFKWCFVVGIKAADNSIILMNSKANSNILIEGSAAAITKFSNVTINSKHKIEISGDAALKYVGIKGPFLMVLVQLNRFPAIFGETDQVKNFSNKDEADTIAFDEPIQFKFKIPK